jgi:hypothetical protein
MNRLLGIAVPCVLVLSVNSAWADVVSVTAVADSRVDLNNPTTSFPSGDLFADKQGTPETVATNLQYFYAQFNLPSGLTGLNMQSINSVQLALSRTGPNFSLTYHVYGVFDTQDTASADTYTWNGGVGYDPSHNLVKFLSADEISYYSDPAKSSFVGIIETATPGSGPYDFTSIAQSPTAAANLKNLILNDTDGRITFYLGIRQNFGVDSANTFASIENGTLAGPKLTIDYVPAVPEPGALGLVALVVAVASGYIRRYAR